MPINGVTKNIAINARGQKNVDPSATFVPYHIDIRNGVLDDAGNLPKRPGYASEWDVSNAEKIALLIPDGPGYAVTNDGKIYKLGDTITELTEPLAGDFGHEAGYHPTYVLHNDLIIIADGSKVVKIEDGDSDTLADSPPRGLFVERISDYTLISGYLDADGEYTEFSWSAFGNPENWSTGGTGFSSVRKDGGKITGMKVIRDVVYFFKENNMEGWRLTSSGFLRNDAYSLNIGCIAPHSIVKAQNAIWWFGSDGDFHVVSGGQEEIVSFPYRAELDKVNYPKLMYGFHFRKESVIRWFAPVEGKCFTYDYRHKNWTEDNKYSNGEHTRLPINAYMEKDNKQYIGDYDPSGEVYEWSKDHKDDNGTEMNVFRQFAIIPFESNNNARYNRISFRLKRGVATASETAPLASFQYRLDKGPWSMTENISLGEEGDYEPTRNYFGLGVGREIEMKVTVSDAVDYLLTGVYLTAEELSR